MLKWISKSVMRHVIFKYFLTVTLSVIFWTLNSQMLHDVSMFYLYLISEHDSGVTPSHLVICSIDSRCRRVGRPCQAVNRGGFSVGGCVVPPGTAAMCQTGGEEERGSQRAEERKRAMKGGRSLQKEQKEREKKQGGTETLPVCSSAVSQNNIKNPLVGVMCLSVQL